MTLDEIRRKAEGMTRKEKQDRLYELRRKVYPAGDNSSPPSGDQNAADLLELTYIRQSIWVEDEPSGRVLMCEKCGPVQLTKGQYEYPASAGWHCPMCNWPVQGDKIW